MGGLFLHEFVTGPVSSTDVSAVMSLANTTPNNTLAAVFVMPNPVGDGEIVVPAQSVVTFKFDLSAPKGQPFNGWLRIQIQSDHVIPTVTIFSDAGTQVYLPGDFVVFDLPTGERLW